MAAMKKSVKLHWHKFTKPTAARSSFIKHLRNDLCLVDHTEKLRKLIIGPETKVKNSQIDVIVSLWREGLIDNEI